MAISSVYCTATDIKDVYPNIDEYDSKTPIYGWESATCGGTQYYRAFNVGSVENLFVDGINMQATKYSKTDASTNTDEVLDDSETGIDVVNGAKLNDDSFIMIDSEIMAVTAIGGNTLTVSRGQLGTLAAAHLTNTDVYQILNIDTSADTLTSADPSDISASIAAAGADDEITIEFHSLYIQETVDRPYELFVNSGVFSGSQIYNFENIVDTDLINVPKFSTKDVDLGAPGVRKNLIKVYVTVKNADNIFLKYTLNGEDRMYDLRPSFGSAESISTTGPDKAIFELVPEYGAQENTRKGFYSIQLHFSTSYPQSNFALDDISIVYRSLGVR